MSSEHQRKRLESEDVGDTTRVIFLDRKIMSEQDIQIIVEQLHLIVDGRKKRKIILDFKNVEHLSTAMFGRFITLQKKVNVAGGKLVLYGIAQKIFVLFRITMLDKIFTIAENEEDAMKKMVE